MVFTTPHHMRVVIAARVASMTMELAALMVPMAGASLVEEMHALKRRAAAPASVVASVVRVVGAAEPEAVAVAGTST